MYRFALFVLVAAPAFLLWAAYHAFIKKDFAAIKSDFTIGVLYFALAGVVFYLISLV